MNYLALTFAFLGLFNYPSKVEAGTACRQWASSGYSHELNEEYESGYESSTTFWRKVNKYSRYCRLEVETNQYIGWTRPNIDRSKINISNVNDVDAWQPAKHFRF